MTFIEVDMNLRECFYYEFDGKVLIIINARLCEERKRQLRTLALRSYSDKKRKSILPVAKIASIL